MEKRITTTQIFKESLRLLLVLAFLTATYVASLAGESITIKGNLLLHDASLEDAVITVIGDHPETKLQLLPGGKFKLKLKTDSEILLRFEKEGFLAKEIKVDTKNVFLTKKAKKDNRVIKFDVELMPENHGKQLLFAEPVGHISFLKGSGLMQVGYLYEMVEVARNGGQSRKY